LYALICCIKVLNKSQKAESQASSGQTIERMIWQAQDDALWCAELERLIGGLKKDLRKSEKKQVRQTRLLEQPCRACGLVRDLSHDEKEEEEERRRETQQPQPQPQPGPSRSHTRSSGIPPRTRSSRRLGIDEERYWQAGANSRRSSLHPVEEGHGWQAGTTPRRSSIHAVEEGHGWQAGTTPAQHSDGAGSYDADDDASYGIASSVGVSRPVAKATAVPSGSTRPVKQGRVLTGKPVLQVVNAGVSEISPRAAHLTIGDESDEGEPADIPLRRMPRHRD
jgi:hypothetical protein